MNLLALIALAFGMSTDAFAAAVVRGTSEAQLAKSANSLTVTPKTALKIGMIFGMTEAITPIIGYFIGKFAHSWVQAFDHWLSFVLLVGIGGHLIYETLMDKEDSEEADAEADNDMPKSPSLAKTILTAIATSIDAMVVGVSLAFLGVSIWLASLLIGIATFIMASVGVFVGAKLGAKVGKIAQIIGGLVLMGIGGLILMTHLASH